MRLIPLALVLALGAQAAAADCPLTDPVARDVRTGPLFQELAQSSEEDSGMQVASQIWSIWAEAPDATAQELLDFGMTRIRWGEFGEAEKALSRLVTYCPDYPEGWNQRAFARFLMRDYDGAMSDLDRTLELEPRHFGALAGQGLTLLSQGDREQGMEALRRAVNVHPWINERHLLPPEEKT
ncbi:MAG: hypothetical protein AAF674_03530 [Pseudomonadota bacterium]